MEAGLSLGSNMGDRLRTMSAAKERILSLDHVRYVTQSPMYETTPVDVKPEYRDLQFLNSVLIVESDLGVERWIEEIGKIEDDMGRKRDSDRNAPRPIDIDLLYAGDLCIDSGGIVVPHPRWMQRRFVVEPLAAVRPDLNIPGARETVGKILQSMPRDEGVSQMPDAW